jgi:hypothetical protein
MRASIVFTAIALTASVSGAQTPVLASPAVPQIVASGRGEEHVTPDRARVSIGVQTEARTAAAAAAENARKQKMILDTLRGLGIPAAQITTTGYNVFPQQRFDEKTRTSSIIGYTVSNTVVVELRKIEQTGAVLDAALGRGANMISGLDLYAANLDEPRRKALASAVASARGDAEALARAAGGSLGELLEMSSNAMEGPPVPMPRMAMRADMAQAASSTPISEGTQTVTAMVSARWRFVSGR